MADADVRIVLDDEAITELFRSAEVLDMLMEIAERQIVPAAQALAPHLTGAGADSIAPEVNMPRGSKPVEVRVSWAKVRYYMYFHEKGAKHLPARPFLVPALLGAQ